MHGGSGREVFRQGWGKDRAAEGGLGQGQRQRKEGSLCPEVVATGTGILGHSPGPSGQAPCHLDPVPCLLGCAACLG